MKSFKKMTKTTKITIATGIAALGLTCGATLMISGKDTKAQETKVSEPAIGYVADSKLKVKETKEDKNKREAAEKAKQDAANKRAEEAKKAEAERVAAEQAEQQRQAEAAAQAEAERVAAEQAEQQRQAEAAAQAEAERVAAEQAEQQRQAEAQAQQAATQQAAAPAQNQGATYSISGVYVGSVGAVQGFIDSHHGTYGVSDNPGSGAGQTWFGHTDFGYGGPVGGAGMWQHSAKPGQTINANGVIYVINSVQSLPWNGSATWGIINSLGANQIMLQSCLTADSKTNTIIVATRQ